MSKQSTGSPPHSPQISNSRKSPKTTNSDTPSAFFNNENGRNELDCRLCSVLSDSLGLPLLYSLYKLNPDTLPEGMKRTERSFSDDQIKCLDGLFQTSVQNWAKNEKREEPQLTRELAKNLEKHCAVTNFHADFEVGVDYAYINPRRYTGEGNLRIDILLSPTKREEGTTPYALIEVGRSNSNWWAKLDQNVKYIDQLGARQGDARLRFDAPLLCAVLTLENEGSEDSFAMKLGIFLCVPRKDKTCRMMFLWNVLAKNLEDASKAFGNLLRVTSQFAEWRGSSAASYTYLSSNCCKVGEKVLRSYDHRFRPTNRKPEVYVDEKCAEIVGGVTKRILQIPDGEEAHDEFDAFFNKSKERGLLVIEVPFREGTHVASAPTDFLPVIEQLQKLHNLQYVHGDIRGFNTVFNNGESTLIDFDFSGRPKTQYPEGYLSTLRDGIRMGKAAEGGNEDENTKLQYWHDWYALNQLIFKFHFYEHDNEEIHETILGKIAVLRDKGENINGSTPNERIKELFENVKKLLLSLEEKGVEIKPSQDYESVLEHCGGANTYYGATGSPPPKKKQA